MAVPVSRLNKQCIVAGNSGDDGGENADDCFLQLSLDFHLFNCKPYIKILWLTIMPCALSADKGNGHSLGDDPLWTMGMWNER